MEAQMILGGKVRLYGRLCGNTSPCLAYLPGREWRVSSREASLSRTTDFAEDWYLELRGKLRSGEVKTEKTCADAATAFTREYAAMTAGARKGRYVRNHHGRPNNGLLPFLGKTGWSEIGSSVPLAVVVPDWLVR